jgi:hypothetical protein
MCSDTMAATEILDFAGRMGVIVALSPVPGKIMIKATPAPPLALMKLLLDHKPEVLEALHSRAQAV